MVPAVEAQSFFFWKHRVLTTGPSGNSLRCLNLETGCMLTKILYILMIKKMSFRDFPGGPVAKTVLPMQGTWVRPLVRELDPTSCN